MIGCEHGASKTTVARADMRGLVTDLTCVRREAVLNLYSRIKFLDLSLNAFEGSSHRGCMFTLNEFKVMYFFVFHLTFFV